MNPKSRKTMTEPEPLLEPTPTHELVRIFDGVERSAGASADLANLYRVRDDRNLITLRAGKSLSEERWAVRPLR